MRVKLLRKIRKRYSWTWNEQYSRYDVVDKKSQKAIFINKEYVLKEFGNTEPPCGFREAKYRLLRGLLYDPFIVRPLEKIMFRALERKIKRKNS